MTEVLEDGGHCGFTFLVTNKLAVSFFAQMKRRITSRNKTVFSTDSMKMINFCKNSTCPPPQKLLAFQTGENLRGETRIVREHLTICEFCAAEVEFYARFPPSEEVCSDAKIPPALYQLAEALLGGSQKNFAQFNKLLNENEILTLGKA